MDNISKYSITLGVLLIVFGLIWHFTKGQIPLGSLPGDIKIEGEHSKFYFPITTCLIISALLSIISYFLKK